MPESNNIKQVIIIRRDLKMRRGKEICQGSHASIAFLKNNFETGDVECLSGIFLTGMQQEWLLGLQRKICLQVETEAELQELHQKALTAGLESHIITDLGLTEFNGQPTVTCLAIGPDYDEKIDAVTGNLKTY